MRQSGELHYLGRSDDQIKVRGFRIEPREIETVLLAHRRVANAVVVPRDYGEGDIRLAAYVVPVAALDQHGRDVIAQDLARHAAAHLPAHMQPSVFEFVTLLPLTEHGKIDRAALRAQPRDAAEVDRVETAGSTIAILTEIWQEILDVATVAADDDFFDIGGTSLAMVRMIARVNERCGLDLEVGVLLDGATITRLARAVERELQEHRKVETQQC